MTPIRLAVAASLVLSLCLAVLQPGRQGNVLSGLEGYFLDIRFSVRGKRAPPDGIAILAIDDLSLEQSDAFPLPRDVIGDAISIAVRKGANAVVLDLLLFGPTENDPTFVAALAQQQNTVLAFSLTEESPTVPIAMIRQIEENGFFIVRNSLPAGPSGVRGPQLEFAKHAQMGHVNLRLDDGGTLRRIPLALRFGDTGPALPSLSVVASRLGAGLEPDALSLISGETLILGDRRIPLTRDNSAVLNYFGPSGTIPTWSIAQVEAADLEGKVVFIGATANGYSDNFNTPFDVALPGVEALATLTANILDQTTLRRDQTTWVLDVLLAIIAGTIAAVAASRGHLPSAALACLATFSAAIATLHLAFLASLWLDAVTLLCAVSLGTVLGFAASWETNRRRVANLSRYQSPQLVEVLANRASPDFDGRTQKAAVLFVDLVNFTQRSANIGPVETGKLLNQFHTLVNDAAQRWSGVVSYTAGDGAMVVFGLPEAAHDDTRRALDCANDLIIQLSEDGHIGGPSHPTPIRIGAHYGEVYAIILGDRGRSTPTVTGDVVNVASRLQEKAKALDALMVISNDLYEGAGRDMTQWQSADPVILRGRSDSLGIWVMKSIQLET